MIGSDCLKIVELLLPDNKKRCQYPETEMNLFGTSVVRRAFSDINEQFNARDFHNVPVVTRS